MDVKFQFARPENEAFLRYFSNTNKYAPKIKISLTEIHGAFLYSRIKTSSVPITQTSGSVLTIPIIPEIKHQAFFLYFTYEDHLQINRYLYTSYQLFFLKYFANGKLFNQPTNEIIISFISKMKLTNSPSLYDKLKKFEYRQRQKAILFYENADYDIDL